MIPIAVGEDRTAFSWRSVKVGGARGIWLLLSIVSSYSQVNVLFDLISVPYLLPPRADVSLGNPSSGSVFDALMSP